jgi:hypothetical protein
VRSGNQSIQLVPLCVAAARIGSLVVLLCVLLNDKAYAYLDPGTGSLSMYAALAAVAGAAVSVRDCWRRIKGLLRFIIRKTFSKSTPSSD